MSLEPPTVPATINRKAMRLALLLGLCAAPACTSSDDACGTPGAPACSSSQDSITVTEVKQVGGRPRIFVNGAEARGLMMTDVYHYRDSLNPHEIAYGEDWVSGIKQIIDDAASLGTQVVSLPVWWNELDRAETRPTPVTAKLDFSPLDRVMDYARDKKVLVMLSPEPHKMIPRWWAEENGYPLMRLDRSTSLCIPKQKDAEVSCIPKELCSAGQPCCGAETASLFCCTLVTVATSQPPPFNITARRAEAGMVACAKANDEPYKTCESCATDAFGWKYPFGSMGQEKMRADFGEFIKAVVDRYKNHPTLFGWEFTLGAMGEDAYGDYTEMLVFGRETPGQLSDYSPFFARELFTWLKNKYLSTEELRKAWDDSTVDLDHPAIPSPATLFANGQVGPFPDTCFTAAQLSSPELSQKGRDFFAFREHMRDTDRQFFVSLFSERDPSHLLIYGNACNDNVLGSAKIHGSAGNPNLDGIQTGDAFDVSSYARDIEVAMRHGKVMLYGAENGCGIPTENANQLKAIERFGKAVKCFGAYFGYVSEIRQKSNGTTLTMPSWTSEAAKAAIKRVASYDPPADCATSFGVH